ncbi:MAG TPA: hypothetical protein VH877_07250 [Polyangia bacterium]|jgi:hypothetical protein|nr:hypothetical protein [Polyangia bacterium]
MRGLFAVLGLLLLTTLAACPGAGGSSRDAGPDAGALPDLQPAPDLGCYSNPQTHVEIINACTSSQSLDKTPRLPLARPDGTLPPLP